MADVVIEIMLWLGFSAAGIWCAYNAGEIASLRQRVDFLESEEEPGPSDEAEVGLGDSGQW